MGNRCTPPREELPAGLALSLFLARMHRGLGLREAANLIGISPGYLVKLEAGTRCPSRSVARDVARVLLKGYPRQAKALWEASLPNAGRDFKPRGPCDS